MAGVEYQLLLYVKIVSIKLLPRVALVTICDK